MPEARSAGQELYAHFRQGVDVFSDAVQINTLRNGWPSNLAKDYGPEIALMANLIRLYRISPQNKPTEAEAKTITDLRGRVEADLDAKRLEATNDAMAGADDDTIEIHQLYIIELENFLRYINAIISKLDLAASIQRARPTVEERRGIDPDAIWDSYAKWKKLAQENEDTSSPDVVDRVERALLNYAMSVLVTNYWDSWNDEKKFSDIMRLPVGKDQVGGRDITIAELIDNHPPGPASGPGSEKLMRERLQVITKAVQGGVHFNEMAKSDNTHKDSTEHFQHWMFNGDDWEQLMSIPALAPGEKDLGDSAGEAIGILGSWNSRFIKTTPEERAEIATEVDAEIAANRITIPSKRELETALHQYESQKEKTFSGIVFKNVGNLDAKTVLFLYNNVAKKDYARFASAFSIELQKPRVKAKEKARQEKFGLFPLRKYGEAPRRNEAGEIVKNLELYLPHITIAVGCYQLGLGNYEIIRREHPAGSGNEVLGTRFTDSFGTVRELTREERDKAYAKGKAATLLGFHTYQANGGPIGDDNVERKSNITAVRLYDTAQYRLNYASTGREGRFNLGYVKRLNIHPLDYMAANGKSIRRLMADRAHRQHADYKLMGDILHSQVVENYNFAEKMYAGYTGGLDDAIDHFDIMKLVTLERPNQFFSLTEYINIDDNALTALKKFVTQKIGYLVDRNMVIGKEDAIRNGYFDDQVWEKVVEVKPGEWVFSPLPSMLAMSDEDKVKFNADIRKFGFKSAIIKAFLTPMLVETLMRVGRREVEPYWIQGLVYILSGQDPEARYAIRNKDNLTSALSTSDEGVAFNYTAEEVYSMIATAAKEVKGGLEVFLSQQGGH